MKRALIEGVKLRKLLRKPKVIKLTAEQALTFLLTRSFSKENYLRTRLLTKQQGADIFPSYDKVLAVKNRLHVFIWI